jgi:hypothetical protein
MAVQNNCNDCVHKNVCSLFANMGSVENPKREWFNDFDELKNEIYEAIGKECLHFEGA